jgi:ferrous-iron efflux pump FieF
LAQISWITGVHLILSDNEKELDINKGVDQSGYPHLMRAATYASVAVASILILIKTGAWFATDSLSLLSSLVDSILDAGASLVNLFAVSHALQPADKEHRFGHGKAEALASLAQAAFIAGSGAFLLLESVDRFVKPQEISNSDIGIVVMVISIVMTLLLVGFQTYVVRRTKSIAINADSLHYRADILVNIAVITSLVCSVNLGWTMADPIFALLIICYMSVGSYKIGAQALDVLMDREFPDEDRKRIKEIAESHESVLNVHDMRTRSSGATSFIEFHAEMPKDISLSEAHEIADEVMYMVEEVFPNTEVLIHQDPEGVDERRDVI